MKDSDIKVGYADTMRRIKTPIIFVKDLQKKRTPWHFSVAVVAVCLLVFTLVLTSLPLASPTLVVYAADGSYEKLGNSAVVLEMEEDVALEFGMSMDNGWRVTFPFQLGCTDETVKKISYSIEGVETALEIADMSSNRVWFATKELTAWEVLKTERNEGNKYPYVYAALDASLGKSAYKYDGKLYVRVEEPEEGDDIAFATNLGEAEEGVVAYRYHGSVYEQTNGISTESLKLVVNFEKKGNELVAEDIVINVTLHYEGGERKTQQLLIQQAFTEHEEDVTLRITKK